jgi:hypothetical protein
MRNLPLSVWQFKREQEKAAKGRPAEEEQHRSSTHEPPPQATGT